MRPMIDRQPLARDPANKVTLRLDQTCSLRPDSVYSNRSPAGPRTCQARSFGRNGNGGEAGPKRLPCNGIPVVRVPVEPDGPMIVSATTATDGPAALSASGLLYVSPLHRARPVLTIRIGPGAGPYAPGRSAVALGPVVSDPRRRSPFRCGTPGFPARTRRAHISHHSETRCRPAPVAREKRTRAGSTRGGQ